MFKWGEGLLTSLSQITYVLAFILQRAADNLYTAKKKIELKKSRLYEMYIVHAFCENASVEVLVCSIQ